MTQYSTALISALGICVALNGCVPKTNVQLRQITVNVQVPPIPPTAAELEKPPNIILEKAQRDPFIALNAPPSREGGSEMGSSAGGGSLVVSGIILGGGQSSAILESGMNSYIVHMGDRVEGYNVTSITPKTVTLTRGKEKVVLSLPR